MDLTHHAYLQNNRYIYTFIFLQDLIIMGAPGSYYWTGSIFVYNSTANTFRAYTDSNNQVKFGSYLGI